jgi:hypothetical protein
MLVMDAGKAVEYGTPAEVLRNQASFDLKELQLDNGGTADGVGNAADGVLTKEKAV